MKLTEQEKDFIEAIRNFKASKGRMDNPIDMELYIYQMLADLMGM